MCHDIILYVTYIGMQYTVFVQKLAQIYTSYLPKKVLVSNQVWFPWLHLNDINS